MSLISKAFATDGIFGMDRHSAANAMILKLPAGDIAPR
jgi:hypothetical protein